MAKKKRTELRSSAGKKLYAVRNEEGKFEDIQSYQRAHSMDIKRVSQDELAKKAAMRTKTTAAKSPKKSTIDKSITKTVAKKKTSKKVAAKKKVSKKADSKTTATTKATVKKK